MDKDTEKTLDRVNEDIKAHSQKDLKTLRKYLLRVVNGKEKDQKVTAKGDIVIVPVPAQVRVMAARALKEMVIDKTVSDKKESTQKTDVKFTVVDAVKAVHERKEKELELEKAGKLKRIGG